MTNLWIASLIWAFSFSLIKGELTGLPALLVAFVRMGLSLLVFLPFFRKSRMTIKQFLLLLLVGGLQFGLMYIAYIQSFQTLHAYEIALFTIFTPFYVMLIDDLYEKKVDGRNLVAVILAIGGTFIIKEGWQVGEFPWVGFGLVQLSNVAFALGQYLYAKMNLNKEGSALHFFAPLYLGAVLVTGVPMLLTVDIGVFAEISRLQWVVLIYLGIVASGIGFFLWNTGAKRVSTGSLAVMNNMKIPLTILVALVFFGEQTNLLLLAVGGGLIVLAELLVMRQAQAG
jgi:drug/metabolite transporter (DMT)-like permease